MFSGIIRACEPIVHIDERNGIRRYTIQVPLDWQLSIGESVAVDGVCSTVVGVGSPHMSVEYMPETLRITTLKSKEKNDIVNLERSLLLGDFVSGHLVSGHVDTTGIITETRTEEDSHVLTIAHPTEYAQYIIPKGSIAINGVSLTVIDPLKDCFSVAVIPHTWTHTNLSTLTAGSRVNLEYDMIAKYVAQHISHGKA